MRKLAIRIGAVDAPNQARKVQVEPVPYLGGVAIVIGVLVATYTTVFIKDKDIGLASTVLIPALIMGTMGLVDDLRLTDDERATILDAQSLQLRGTALEPEVVQAGS